MHLKATQQFILLCLKDKKIYIKSKLIKRKLMS